VDDIFVEVYNVMRMTLGVVIQGIYDSSDDLINRPTFQSMKHDSGISEAALTA
jgi:hypothetical protein